MTRNWTSVVGALLALSVLIFAILKLGYFPVLLFAVFTAQAIQDALKGRINIMLFLPIIVVPIMGHVDIFFKLFVNLTGILLVTWIIIFYLHRSNKIPEDLFRFGLGDVLGIPFALTTAWILAEFWGVVLFGSVTSVLLVFAIRKKNIRLLPWLVPGLCAALILGLAL